MFKAEVLDMEACGLAMVFRDLVIYCMLEVVIFILSIGSIEVDALRLWAIVLTLALS